MILTLMTRYVYLYIFWYFSQEIDDYIGQAKDKSYDTLVHFGRKGLNVAATAAVMAATKVMQTRLFCIDQGVQWRGIVGRASSLLCCLLFT